MTPGARAATCEARIAKECSDALDVRRVELDVRGYDLDVRRVELDVRGYDLDVRGYDLDVRRVELDEDGLERARGAAGHGCASRVAG